MCTTCGCGAGETRIEGQAVDRDDPDFHVHADGTGHVHAPKHGYTRKQHGHSHRHADGTVHAHDHSGDHRHDHDHARIDYGNGPAGAHAPGMTQTRMVQIERDILSKNDAYAASNRQALCDRGILALNLVSSPGSGKTTLLCRTIGEIRARHAVAVIEGDQQTSHDADRIRATGAPAVQINTGKGCHLDAHMVGEAINRLSAARQLADDALLFIENVGNLVCPAAFDLGEDAKVAILSVTEGEDKPLKYPDLFRAARLMLLNKIDLLPYLDFDVQQAIDAARRVNPQIEVIQVSATSGAGMAEWIDWIESRWTEVRQRQSDTVADLRRRIAELERRLEKNG